MSRSFEKIDDWIRSLVIEYNYLPLAYRSNLTVLLQSKSLYTDVEHIKGKAVDVLTADTEEDALYRQAIYRTLAWQGVAFQQDVYVIGRIASRFLRGRSTLENEIVKIHESIATKRFKTSEYKLAVRLAADLVVLNFGYVIPDYTHDIIVPILRMSLSTKIKPIGATIQSLALCERLPVYTAQDIPLDSVEAEELVGFAIGLRQYVVNILLTRRPTKFSDLYALLRAYVKSELERKSRIRQYVEPFARLAALIEARLVPYYLHHYGYLKIDPASLIFSEIRYV